MSKTDKDQLIGRIAHSCEIGAECLERLSRGEQFSRESLRLVAEGLRDAIKDANPGYGKAIMDVVLSANIYISNKDRQTEYVEFSEEQLRDALRAYNALGR